MTMTINEKSKVVKFKGKIMSIDKAHQDLCAFFESRGFKVIYVVS